MATTPCDGCGRRVSVAGGIANLWSFDSDPTEGLTLELADGSEHFLCFECIEDLPDDPTTDDVESLPDRPQNEPIESDLMDEAGAGGLPPVGVGIAIGAGVGVAIGVAIGDLQYGLTTGAALGLLLALAVERLRG